MGFTKFATFEDSQVLDIKGSATRLRTATLDKVGDYDNYRTGDGFMYVRIRAISSRVNKNHDGWPSVELAGGRDIFTKHARQSSSGFTVEAKEGDSEYGFATFLGKPNFIDHNNSDPDRARGVVVDAKLRVLPPERLAAFGDDYWTAGSADPEHLPPTEVELLIEIDAQSFPKYAKAVRNGELDGFSMGCDVDMSRCSHCGHEATNPTEYCSHILMKGATHDYRTADGRRMSKKSYENCYGIKFFEISGVFEPADETALAREVVAAIQHEGIVETEIPGTYAPDPLRGHYHGEVQAIADEIRQRNPDMPDETVYDLAQRRLTNPANATPREESIEDYAPKIWDYADANAEGLPEGSPPVDRPPGPHVTHPEFYDEAQDLLDEKYPQRPVMNDPTMSHVAKMRKGAPDPGDDTYFGGEAGSSEKAFKAMKDQYGDEKGEEVYYATRNKHKGKGKKSHGEQWPWEEPGAMVHYPSVLEGLEHQEGLEPGTSTDRRVAIKQIQDYLDKVGYQRGAPGGEGAAGGAGAAGNPADPRMGRVAENEKPQSEHTKAPDDVDTMRQEQICPICGNTVDGEECAVCGWEKEPEGFDNPDLQKAKEIRQEAEDNDAEPPQPEVNPSAPQHTPPQAQQQPTAGSYLQTRNREATASVMSEMRWAPNIDNERLAGRVNKQEVPIKPESASGKPTDVTVVKSPAKPVTSSMRTAQELIQATNQQGDTMSTTRTADGATPPSDTSSDARVDVTGVGGVIEPSNESASKADAQVDVLGVGSTGVTDVDSDKTESLPTASDSSDDSGFNTDKNIEAIPTKTYDDSDGTEKGFTDPVTTDAYPQDAEVYAGERESSYDSRPFFAYDATQGEEIQDGDPGSANKGTQPVDSVGKADDRVDVLSPAATPENNSGPTKTWSGTDGNSIYKQQDPVTSESIATDGFTSHVVACLKLADLEVDLGLTPKERKYDRISELEGQSDGEIVAQHNMLSRVRTAGLAKLEQARKTGATRVPSGFGQATAAGRRFAGATEGELVETQPEELAEDQFDAGLFS